MFNPFIINTHTRKSLKKISYSSGFEISGILDRYLKNVFYVKLDIALPYIEYYGSQESLIYFPINFASINPCIVSMKLISVFRLIFT